MSYYASLFTLAFILLIIHIIIFITSICFLKLPISSSLVLTGLFMNTLGSILFGIDFLLRGNLFLDKYKKNIEEQIPLISKETLRLIFSKYLEEFIQLTKHKSITDESGVRSIPKEQVEETFSDIKRKIIIALSDIPKETIEAIHENIVNFILNLHNENTKTTQTTIQKHIDEYFKEFEKEIYSFVDKRYKATLEGLIKKSIGWFGLSMLIIGFILQIIAIIMFRVP